MSLLSPDSSPILDSTNSHFNQIYDAVHGTIDFQSFGAPSFTKRLRDILDSKFMRRLQHVKQLGFVSKNYISAGHNRYTHSLGTMKMMRDICTRLTDVEAFNRREFPIMNGLTTAFPDTFSKKNRKHENIDALISHLLVAALVQDIGELPYNVATATFLSPSFKVRKTVANAFKVDITNCEAKTIFALYWLCHEDNAKHLEGLSLPLLAYLISGRRPSNVPEFCGLRALRHMADGAVDADRLDYVHRDAFHTIGVRRSPEAIIASLLYYDDEGPVFSSPGPVSDFLAMRAILWSSVYLAPPNRFRVVLFSHILRDLREQLRTGRSTVFDGLSDDGLEYEQLPEVDDLWMDDVVRKVSDNVRLLRTPRAAAAAKALTSSGASYDYFWLGSPDATAEDSKVDFEFTIPDQLFWDSYSDYQSHTLYAHRSIRVQVDHFRYLGGTASLEDCSGPFNAMLTERSSALPMPGRLLLFQPKNAVPARLPVWADVENRIADNSLFYRLKYEDRRGLLDFKDDTRGEDNFEGEPLFISFAFEDVLTVRLIANELFRRRHHYYCLLEPYTGVGKTARANSQRAVQDAAAILIVYSLSYANKFKNDSQGNLASEVFAMIRRRDADKQFKIIPLSLESYRSIGANFPWLQLGFEDGNPPMVGPPLRNASDEQIGSAVGQVIKCLGRR